MTLFATTTQDTPGAPPMSQRGKFGPWAAQGAVLRARRAALKLSQENVADRYGSSQTYISSVERGWEGIGSASLDWVRRYAAALDWSPEELMDAVQIEYAKAGQPTPVTPSGSYAHAQPDNLYSATIEVQVASTGQGGEALQSAKVVVNAQIAAAYGELRGLRMQQGYLNAVPTGMIALYAPEHQLPQAGELVAVEIDGEWHIAYMTVGGLVETDRPISMNTPLRFRPDAILGVVVQRVDDSVPRRLN